MHKKLIAISGALAALTVTASAQAQTAAPAAAQPAPGPMIPGVCTYSNERAIGASTVGQAVAARMKQLSQAVDAELSGERTALQTEGKTLQAAQQAGTMDQNTLQQRALVFNQRAETLEKKTQIRVRELQATEGKQLQKIAEQLDPILKQVYAERNCGLLLDRNSLYGANPAMDVTDTVIQKLNAKVTTLSFDRERLDQQPAAAAAAPAAPRPAVAAPAKPTKK
jgi:outer membrane protein